MTKLERNGISGLLLRGVVIALAVVIFGCAPKAPFATTHPAVVSAAAR